MEMQELEIRRKLRRGFGGAQPGVFAVLRQQVDELLPFRGVGLEIRRDLRLLKKQETTFVLPEEKKK